MYHIEVIFSTRYTADYTGSVAGVGRPPGTLDEDLGVGRKYSVRGREPGLTRLGQTAAK